MYSSHAPFANPASHAPMSPPLPKLWSLSIMHRLRRKCRSTKSFLRSRSPVSSAASITHLDTSFDISRTLHALNTHKWSLLDAQYILIFVLAIFSFLIIPTFTLAFKTFVVALLGLALLLPITQQFFFPVLPIFSWLTFFYSYQFLPIDYRPPIWVRVLPALENIMYGANLSEILSAHKATALDIMGWLPYGITHFGAPFVTSILIFLFAPPKSLPVFARAFGYMNLTGVMIQILLPCSPPWYETLYGLQPANYSMQGSPAGLAAIDKLFGIKLYTSTFTASPLVFGAFPSLHSGCATIEALFLSHVFPRLKPLFIAYTMWLWWATMYLSHHYAVDLVAGSLLSGIAFFISELEYLPLLQPGKMFRWDYDYIEIGHVRQLYGYDVAPHDDYDHDGTEMDMATWGVRDAYSTSASQSPASRSKSPDEANTWDGDTLAAHSDSDVELHHAKEHE